MKTTLVTGGAGYIGSHTLIELINNNFEVVVIDNLANSSRESLRRIEQITGHEIPFIEADVRDQSALDDVFTTYDIDSVIHFAGLKAVGESVAKPLEYYDNNLVSTLALLEAMREHSVKQLVFSSSATVYGNPSELPLRETSTVGVGLTNPYGKTKYMIEQIIQDYCAADPAFEATILRYFNPIGAHQSGQIGEDPNGIPNNLLPYVAQVAVGKLQSVGVFGNDYDTPDGTGVRDYIHVVDLARGHVAALQHMKAGANVYNLGTGSGTSVLEIIKAFSKACGRDLPYEIKPRRAGDIAACYADCSKAERELGWRAELSIEQACADSWRWQSQNPNGFSK
ncbi:UDP-glucose 4-epimerase GalE [TM7 phylum sp. oral taxon 346]|jgi:UDP-glucose 4-epimerase|nr:UDP-glucose 4-epimerase GalE [TM7 phylum sp. oral taxon 346]